MHTYESFQVTSAFKERAMYDRLSLQNSLSTQRNQPIDEFKPKTVRTKRNTESTHEIFSKTVSPLPVEGLNEATKKDIDFNQKVYIDEPPLTNQAILGPLSRSQRLMGIESICEYRSTAVEEAKRLSEEDLVASVSSKDDWKRLLDKCRMPSMSAAAMDTDALIRCIALRWVRWGLHLINEGGADVDSSGIRFYRLYNFTTHSC